MVLFIYFPGRKGVDFPHPGVGPYPSGRPDPWLVKVTDEGDEIRHAWYQWVVFVLFFQVKIGDDSSFRLYRMDLLVFLLTVLFNKTG
jgi:hypothetical protein